MVIKMSLRGFFTKGDNEESETNRLGEFENQVRRMNTLEVHLQRLLKLEAKLGPLLSLKEKLEAADKTAGIHAGDIPKELRAQKQEIEKLKQLIAILQQDKHQSASTNPFTRTQNEASSAAVHAEQMNELRMKIKGLEANLALVNQVQMDLLTQLDALRKQCTDLEQFVIGPRVKEKPIVQKKEIYIDKFFLDKYEQNNNIAQVGIKELSGVLNIGATYGTIPLHEEASIAAEQEETESANTSADADQNDFTATEESYSDIPIEDPGESGEDSPER